MRIYPFLCVNIALIRFGLFFPMKTPGEGGIRTLGSLLGYGALAKRCFQPLSHLTNMFYNNILRLYSAAVNSEL
jgi:hypothetical protein